MNQTVHIDGKEVIINGERNLLELIRKAHIDLPTFCYHSELSIYGACRLCLVDIDGRGIQAACSTPPEAGMRILTHTDEIRSIRRVAVELLLANHEQTCPTCQRSSDCRLQDIARRLGIHEVRFQSTLKQQEKDISTLSLVRDPNKCILCGDCVRMCSEIQGIGAIDFSGRGANVRVVPAFNKDLSQVECVYCGQCSAVCPTGALTVRSEIDDVWKMIHDPVKKVVVQIAPAVRVALGEMFGYPPGEVTIGRIVAALRQIGFDKVYDTSFAADLTVIEEANEFLTRKKNGDHLPQFTSCCPAWVKFAEQYYPQYLSHLSSCKSPQQMFGSLTKKSLPAQLNCARENLVVVSIMPCSAKKFEARRREFMNGELADVDFVLTTRELGRMIEEAGIKFHKLVPESLDLPYGFKTGAGVIFGASGGVSEAVLRYAVGQLNGRHGENIEFPQLRNDEGIREYAIDLDGTPLKLAIVYGLANARKILEKLKAGTVQYDLVEVMACPGGCVGGAGQPIAEDQETRALRAEGIYIADKTLQVHRSQDNPYVAESYRDIIGEINGHGAHELLHTQFYTRKRMSDEGLPLISGDEELRIGLSVCVGTSCYLKGSQDLLHNLIQVIEERDLEDWVEVKATFCFERCDRGPTVRIGDQIIEKCTFEKALDALETELKKIGAPIAEGSACGT